MQVNVPLYYSRKNTFMRKKNSSVNLNVPKQGDRIHYRMSFHRTIQEAIRECTAEQLVFKIIPFDLLEIKFKRVSQSERIC